MRMTLDMMGGTAVVVFYREDETVAFRTDSLQDAFKYARDLGAAGVEIIGDAIVCWPIA